MSREAMQLALEALERCGSESYTIEQEAITALRQALETEQAMKDAIVGGTGVMLDGKRIDPATIYKEEPVAWMCKRDDGHFDVLTDQTCKKCFPVYTAPQKKEWVGLTDDEIMEPWPFENRISFARWVESKVREKNT